MSATGNSQRPSGQRTSSNTSLGRTPPSTPSVRGHAYLTPIRTVVTSPPWARDEPPSPTDELDEYESPRVTAEPRPSDVISLQSSYGNQSRPVYGSNWWTFAKLRPGENPRRIKDASRFGTLESEKKNVSFKDRSTWIIPNNRQSRDDTILSPREADLEATPSLAVDPSGLHIAMPTPTAPFTIAQNKTPGWDTPWQPKGNYTTGTRGVYSHINGSGGFRRDEDVSEKTVLSGSKVKLFRTFLLTNIYVPLLFRFINITLTTAALAIAIRIRQLELDNNVMGVLGSSPTLVIIFASLTLVHVMLAIYLEYFSRPLGLWRTSGKLAYTLLEVCFICAWSAALSLCFDNFFTSLIPCASPSSISWYNQLPRPQSPLPNLGRNEGGVGDTICDDQLALICLVGVGLIMYCTSLIISLFRIFEKVKYHGGSRVGS